MLYLRLLQCKCFINICCTKTGWIRGEKEKKREGGRERDNVFLGVFFPWFFLIFSPSFSRFFCKFFALRGGTLPPYPPPTPWLCHCIWKANMRKTPRRPKWGRKWREKVRKMRGNTGKWGKNWGNVLILPTWEWKAGYNPGNGNGEGATKCLSHCNQTHSKNSVVVFYHVVVNYTPYTWLSGSYFEKKNDHAVLECMMK